MDGFGLYAGATSALKRWTVAPTLTPSPSYGRFGGNGNRIDNSTVYLKKNLGLGTKTTLVVGFAFQYYSGTTPSYHSSYPLIGFLDDSGVYQIKIHVNANYGFDVRDGSDSLLGSSSNNVFSNNRWFYIEAKVVIHDTTGSVEIRINESTVVNLTSQDTKIGSAYVDQVIIRGINASFDLYVDDIYIDDANFHGDCQVREFQPDSDGNSSDFTRSTGSNDYECVDEVESNEDTDYIYSDTLNHKSLFGITTGAMGTVKGVQLALDCRLDQAGTRKITPICRSNSVDYDGTESPELTASYIYEHHIWETDPDDSNAWTQTKLEAAEFGLEITT
jgi:hypothetical protein